MGVKDGSQGGGKHWRQVEGIYEHHHGHCRVQWRGFKVENGLSNSLSSAIDPCDSEREGSRT